MEYRGHKPAAGWRRSQNRLERPTRPRGDRPLPLHRWLRRLQQPCPPDAQLHLRGRAILGRTVHPSRLPYPMGLAQGALVSVLDLGRLYDGHRISERPRAHLHLATRQPGVGRRTGRLGPTRSGRGDDGGADARRDQASSDPTVRLLLRAVQSCLAGPLPNVPPLLEPFQPGARLHCRGCGARARADRRPRHEHRHPGRVQSRLEACGSCQRRTEAHSSRQLPRRTPSGRCQSDQGYRLRLHRDPAPERGAPTGSADVRPVSHPKFASSGIHAQHARRVAHFLP